MQNSAALSEALVQLEQDRVASRSKGWSYVASIMVIGMCGGAYFYFSSNAFLALISVVLGGVISSAVFGTMMGRVRRSFKAKIIPHLLADIDPSLRYQSNGYLDARTFNEAKLHAAPDRYSGKDLVQGYIGDTQVSFSFVHAEEKYEVEVTDANNKTRTEIRYRDIFVGLLFIADFNKHFAGRTSVRHGAAGFFSKLFGSTVLLEDPEFNRTFHVTSTDQVEARYILTSSLMERFKSLRDRVGPLQASFFDSKLYMTVGMSMNALEPTVSRSFIGAGQVEKILANLRSITSIVEELGLNVRIWTKGGRSD